MTTEELAFLNALQVEPTSETARLVYADYLDDHDQSRKAAYLRVLVKARAIAAELEEMRIGMDGEWLDCINAQEDEYEAYILRRGLKLHSLPEIRAFRNRKDVLRESIDFNNCLGDTIRERYEYIYSRLVSIHDALVRRSNRKGESWLVTSPEISSLFETMHYGFSPLSVAPTRAGYIGQDENSHPTYAGVVGHRWHLYKHIDYPQGEMILGIGRNNIPDNNLTVVTVENFVI